MKRPDIKVTIASMELIGRLTQALAPSGLILRGTLHPGPEDGAPEGIAALVLIGNAGPAMWEVFARERRDEPDPLDNWTRRKIAALAAEVGAQAFFPFGGPPYRPFQRWAIKAEGLHQSPIGPLIHPVYGLWHAYRGALGFARPLDVPPPRAAASPCESCAAKPCLSACPAGALAPGKYDVPACVAHVRAASAAPCRQGCLARRACPVGAAFAHGPDQGAFHMAAFLGAYGGPA